MHDDLELSERASVAITFEVVSSLIDYYLENLGKHRIFPAARIGARSRRQLGDRDGFGIWRELMFEFEPPLRKEDLLGPGDPRIPVTYEQYCAGLRKQWERYGHGDMHRTSNCWSTRWQKHAQAGGKSQTICFWTLAPRLELRRKPS